MSALDTLLPRSSRSGLRTPTTSGPAVTRAILLVLFLGHGEAGRGEQLPMRTFGAADGLAGDLVTCLAEDPRGFLWIGTSTGLSRFDGYRFTNFTTFEGLPQPSVSALLVGRDGTLWVGTARGLARLREPSGVGRVRFETVSLRGLAVYGVNTLAEDPDGSIWVGTFDGLLRVEPPAQGKTGMVVTRERLGSSGAAAEIRSLAVAGRGELWIGTAQGLWRRHPEGEAGRRFERFAVWPGPRGWDVVRSLALRGDLLWLTHDRGVFALRLPFHPAEGRTLAELAGASSSAPRPDDGRWSPPRTAGGVGFRPGLISLPRGIRFAELITSPQGEVWVTTSGGLMRFDGLHWHQVGTEQGLADPQVGALWHDRAGNLWLGTEKHGVVRLTGSSFLSYGAADGLASERIACVFEDRDGETVVLASGDAAMRIFVLDGERFEEVTPPFVQRLEVPSWGWNQLLWQDSHREWWLPTGQGLLRFPAGPVRSLKSAKPSRVYTVRDGLPGNDLFRLYEDRTGDLWLSVLDTASTLVRWRRASDRFETMPVSPALIPSAPTAFAEDRAGHLWIGYYSSGLVRWDEREGLRAFAPGGSVPGGFVHDLLLDRAGRIWVAATDGAARIDDPGGATPRFTRYELAGGLAHDSVRALGEDGEGRIYLGSARGLDRLEPATGRLESFTTGDGLANSILTAISRGKLGEMWFGTLAGLSRLRPSERGRAQPPPLFLSSVEVAGVPQLGPGSVARRLGGFELAPGGNRLQVEFSGVSLAAGASLRYQTRLLDVERNWSLPSTNRSVLLAGLAPGRYRFQARAVSGAGLVSPQPVEVSFRVQPPLWRSGWFVSLVLVALGMAVWIGHRSRVARLLTLERIRTRIASDLHDEVGASLSRVSILSEVGKLRLGEDGPPEAAELLTEIGETSRQLSESMSEIVWALDPRKDTLPSLMARLRRFASDVLEAQGVALDFEVPPAGLDLNLSSVERRELYLLLKEAVHNAARHARATRVSLRMGVAGGRLRVEVADDGTGFTPEGGESPGLGLGTMRQRAGHLGGRLELESAPGKGTTIRLEVPLSARRRARKHA